MGFIKEETAILNPDALGHVVGPCVHLMQYTAATQEWFGTVLIACHSELLTAESVLSYTSPSTGKVDVQPEELYQRAYGDQNWSVVRCAPHDGTFPACCRQKVWGDCSAAGGWEHTLLAASFKWLGSVVDRWQRPAGSKCGQRLVSKLASCSTQSSWHMSTACRQAAFRCRPQARTGTWPRTLATTSANCPRCAAVLLFLLDVPSVRLHSH